MISTRSAGLVIDTVVCLTLAKWETVSGRFGGYLTFDIDHPQELPMFYSQINPIANVRLIAVKEGTGRAAIGTGIPCLILASGGLPAGGDGGRRWLEQLGEPRAAASARASGTPQLRAALTGGSSG